MKTTLRNILALFFAMTLATGTVVRAADIPTPGPGDGGHHDLGEFHGFMLQPTPDAPAGSGGWAVIRSHDAVATVHVVTMGLAAGTYTVNATSKADGSATALGTFDVHAPVDIPPLIQFLNGHDGVERLLEFLNQLVSEANFDFPDGYDPTDVASIQVVDEDAVTMLSGDNVQHDGKPGGRDHQHEQFVLQPTADGPADARGHAHVAVEQEHDVITSAALRIETRGLAEGTYTVNVVSIGDGSVSALGTFDVAAPADSEEDSETEVSIPFPDGANPTDVASVQVADVNGVVLLAGDGSVRGGHVEGGEFLHERVVLTVSADAPVDAHGVAEIHARNQHGASRAMLKIKTRGLNAGTYTASVTSVADGSVTVLGTFDVAGTGEEEDGDVIFHTESENGLVFPEGFNPLDVAGLQIADANGVVMLTGDFSNVAASTVASFTAKVRITPGEAAPEARGVAATSSKVRRHKVRQSFTLAAKGVPASSMLTLKVNGNDAGTVMTSRKGRLAVHKLPAEVDVHKITSVTLEDENGATILSAHF
jgi:hypothetical protein